MQIRFEYGKTITPAEMEPWHVYLDGACRGPAVRMGLPAISFDHHADCVRAFTLSTCEQVLTSLQLGFDPTGYTVVVNDIDADTVVAVWLLQDRDRTLIPRVRQMVRRIGFVDAHGPAQRPHPLHRALTLPPGHVQTEDDLHRLLAVVTTWERTGDVPRIPKRKGAPWFGVTRTGEWVSGRGDFASAYAAGMVVGVVCVPGPKRTVGYTIGKCSEFVPYDIPAFLARMGEAEPGWGGASTIGGAPRRPGGLRSGLPRSVVRDAFALGLGSAFSG